MSPQYKRTAAPILSIPAIIHMQLSPLAITVRPEVISCAIVTPLPNSTPKINERQSLVCAGFVWEPAVTIAEIALKRVLRDTDVDAERLIIQPSNVPQ